MRARWAPPAPERPSVVKRNWYLLPVSIYTNGIGRFVVTGTPPEEPGDRLASSHSCDEMGCGSAGDHVLARCADLGELSSVLSRLAAQALAEKGGA